MERFAWEDSVFSENQSQITWHILLVMTVSSSRLVHELTSHRIWFLNPDDSHNLVRVILWAFVIVTLTYLHDDSFSLEGSSDSSVLAFQLVRSPFLYFFRRAVGMSYFEDSDYETWLFINQNQARYLSSSFTFFS